MNTPIRPTLCLLTLLFWHALAAQTTHWEPLDQQLDSLAQQNPTYHKDLTLEMDLNQVAIADFLQTVAELHSLNLTADPVLKNRFMVVQFGNVSVKEVLLYLCKTHQLTFERTGSILHFKPYHPPPPTQKAPEVQYQLAQDRITLRLTNHTLQKVFPMIVEQSPHTLLFTPDIAQKRLTFFVKDLPVETALEQLAQLHQLRMRRSEQGFFLFEAHPPQQAATSPWGTTKGEGFQWQTDGSLTDLSLEDYPIAQLIQELRQQGALNWYQTEPLENMGTISLNIDRISVDELLPILFSNTLSPTTNTTHNYTYRKEKDRYFFGSANNLQSRALTKIVLQHRSIEILEDPYREPAVPTAVPQIIGNMGMGQNYGSTFGSGLGNRLGTTGFATGSSQLLRSSQQQTSSNTDNNEKFYLNNLIPPTLQEGLQIQIDKELNALLVLGNAQKVAHLRQFIQTIDQPVPVILIEVMLIEVNKSSQLESGLSWGIGTEPTTDKGTFFPGVDGQIGAPTANRILGGFRQLRALNLGKLQENFFLQLKALEESGTVKVLSSPKMATLNGHRAVFSNSEISYYAYTSQNFYGFQNPQTSEITNYIPISAGLTLSVKPYVTGNQGVTLDIYVKQSSFNNKRIAEDAPPGIEAREFSSIVRMRNQDIAILGGLVQNTKNNSGKGVPFLARIPIISWFFSEKKMSTDKRRLTVLIQPTLIQ